MEINMRPIGHVEVDSTITAQCWKTSDVEGDLVIDEKYQAGISDLEIGQHIFILFHFHQSPRFSDENLKSGHPENDLTYGVFSTLSPIRPNPIGMAFVEIVKVEAQTIRVRGLDVADKTPIFDIKPDACPWKCNIN